MNDGFGEGLIGPRLSRCIPSGYLRCFAGDCSSQLIGDLASWVWGLPTMDRDPNCALDQRRFFVMLMMLVTTVITLWVRKRTKTG